jgi:GNAT superfamily N-acetyltransferase
VRPGRPEDASALRDIRLESLADSPDAYGETFENCATWGDDVWAQKAREWNFYLAEREGRVVGLARGERHDERPDARYLFAMYVSPAARGSDAAARLVETVSSWAAAEGVNTLYLYVSTAAERARAFYTKVGFVASGACVAMDRDEGLVCEELSRDLSDYSFHVHRVESTALHDLRRRVLRENDPTVSVENPGDLLASSLHYGGFLGERLVVSASLFASPFGAPGGDGAYQLRYMATDFDVQGHGLGRVVLTRVLEDLARRGVEQIWANARVTALDFYTSSGWRVVPHSQFISAETGTEHVVIHRPVVQFAAEG